MDTGEFREKLRAIGIHSADGIANYIGPMIAWSVGMPEDVLEIYGPRFGCNDLDILISSALALSEELRKEMSVEDWKVFFADR